MFFIPFISLSVSSAPTENFTKAVYDYSITLLDEVMKNNNALVEEEDGERFTNIYITTFLQSAKSIYTAKRHSKTLAEALPILKDKVNICDLIIITGVKIFYPKLYEVIKSKGAILSSPLSQEKYDEYNQQIQELRVKLEPIIEWYDEQSDNGNSIREMLILLFPRLNVAYRNMLQTNEDYLHCVEKGRICSDKHFDFYFSVQYVTL
jgi:predicted KAP-like P-loop ATPase